MRRLFATCQPRAFFPLTLALLLAVAACSAAPPTVGTWTGTNGNLDVSLNLSISRDSVWGQGTYTARTPEDLPCGASLLGQSGSVTLRGQVTGSDVGAHADFGSDWSSPYSGKLVGKDTIRGGFLSGDAASCAFVLVRQH